jgi:sugar/nucleoside kinase (ribokinase family)
MQSSSDIFLGWTRGRRGYHFFGRQLRDMKFSMPVEGASAAQLKRYAGVCGAVLARAHAKSGDAAKIGGYLGKTEVFDEALGDFALAYADQTERDHGALVEAVRSGRIHALVEEDL